MKAFRNFSGIIKEIDIDVSPSGEPLLPPDTTVDPKPEDREGHYLSVVGTKWVYIPFTEVQETLDQIRNRKFIQLATYKEWYFNTPVKYDEVLFDGDESSRNRLSQALQVYNQTKVVPTNWVNYKNDFYAFDGDKDKFINLVLTVLQAFNNRHIEMNVIRDKILKAESIEELYNIQVPAKPL